uniref:Uncharacterized protein n=1 Tax=Anser cygnoides TaxID=8845 RepID=A0A8B9ELK0_ANSCY
MCYFLSIHFVYVLLGNKISCNVLCSVYSEKCSNIQTVLQYSSVDTSCLRARQVLDFHTLGICNHYPWHVRSLPFDSSKEAHRKFLEKNLTDEATEIDDLNIKLIIKALPKVAQSGEKNTELVVVRQDQPLKILSPEETEEENEKQTNKNKTNKKTHRI